MGWKQPFFGAKFCTNEKIKLKNEYSITCTSLFVGGGGVGELPHFFEKNDYFGYISNLFIFWYYFLFPFLKCLDMFLELVI
jgi:hypothetical protein